MGILLLGAVGLCVRYRTTYDDRWPHPTAEELDEDFESYTGSEVLVFGEVQSVDGEQAVIHVFGRDNEVVAELTVPTFATTSHSAASCRCTAHSTRIGRWTPAGVSS